jgi:predicted CoA-binding protein
MKTKQREQTVVVLGVSADPERYAYRAVALLKEHGHRVIPVHPALSDVQGIPVVKGLEAIGERVDTLTLYVGPARLTALIPAMVALRPGRVIFNPGTESAEVVAALDAAGVPWEEACTLVMLRTGQFDF